MRNILLKLTTYINRSVSENGAQYKAFGVIGCLLYLGLHALLQNALLIQSDILVLRLIASALCFFLIFSDYWPKALKRYLTIYWYFTLTYCLPFCFIVLISEHYVHNHGLGFSLPFLLLWLMILVDLLSFVVILTIGTLAGLIVSFYMVPNGITQSYYIFLFLQYVIFISITFYFAYHQTRSKEVQDKTLAIKPVAANIAHEIRTPLASITAGASGIKQYLPILLDAYRQAKAHSLPISHIREIHLRNLNETLDKICRETAYTNTIIDMMLMQVSHSAINPGTFRTYSIKVCVLEAIERYPFVSNTRHKLVECRLDNDFLFKGDKLLITHVLFNLLKNAIYFIAEANKGSIKIWFSHKDKMNRLHFKDTGQGITEANLNQIFKEFYTTTPNGSGIGLSFCRNVMESMEGKISCNSVYGEYTEFILSFPSLD